MSDISIQSSVPNESARHFLLKINADDCLSGRPQPRASSDWEGTSFQSTKARASKRGEKLPPEQRRPPERGDKLLIWVNKGNGGTGLTAIAQVSLRENQGTGLRIRVENVSLLIEPRIDDADLRPGDKVRQRDDALEDIKRTRTSKLRFLSASDWEELITRAQSKSAPNRSPEASSSIVITSDQTAKLEDERERTWQLIERRQNQGPFREALITREEGRCAVTGCRVLAVLEAAHLIPFAGGNPKRDSLENGLLLRADIHTLFDRGLMAVDPDTRELWISDKLADDAYRSLRAPDRIIKTGASSKNLRCHFEWAQKQEQAG
jgi:HNH endonuclease